MAESFLSNEVKTRNMRYYTESQSVPKEAQKAFSNGSFSGTDINPMWRLKKLTEMFGPAGIGWYTEILSERSEQVTDGEMIAIVDLNLYVKVDGEWSKPIYGTGGNKLKATGRNGVRVSDEGYKMAYTDALSVACKALGIGADIYFDKDRTKYTAYAETQGEQPKPVERPKKAASAPVESSQKMTAVVDFPQNTETSRDGEITQEMLTALISPIITPMSMEEKLKVVDIMKPIIGSSNYKVVEDPKLRKALWDVFVNWNKEDK